MTRWTLATVFLCLVAWALRVWHLDFQSLWWDEGVSIYLSGAGVRALTISKDFGVDLHPPGYHLLLALWTTLVGPSVFTSRLMSVFSGVVTVPLAVQFTRSLGRFAVTRRTTVSRDATVDRVDATAFISGLLAAVSPIDIFYSQEARMYPLLPAIGAASLIATVRLLHSNRRRQWLVWIAINVVGMYVFYYLALLSIAETGVILSIGIITRRGNVEGPTLARWGAAQAFLVVAYVPWLVVMARGLGGTSLALPTETEVHLTVLQFLADNGRAFTTGFSAPPGSIVFLVLWTALAGVGLATLARRSPAALALLLVCVSLPLVTAGLILLARPFYYPRFVLFILVPLWSLVAFAVTAWPRARAASILVLLLVVAGNGWTWYYERTTPRTGYAPDDYRTVFQTMSERMRPGDLVLGGYPWQAGYVRAYLWRLAPRAVYVKGAASASQVELFVAPAGRAWTLTYSPDRRFDPDVVEETLARRHPTALVDQYGDTRARLFASPSLPSSTRTIATFGQQIGLRPPAAPLPPAVHPGQSVSVVLRWVSLGAISGNYTVFVHLVGVDGKIWGQVDSPPIRGLFPTKNWSDHMEAVDRYSVAMDPNAAAGTYHVDVGLYDPIDGTRLEIGKTPMPVADNQLDVGTVEVVTR